MRDTWPELLSNWREWSIAGYSRRERPVDHNRLAGVMSLASRYLRSAERNASLVVTTTASYAEEMRRRVKGPVVCVRNSPGTVTAAGAAQGPLDELHVLYLGNVGRSQYLATAIQAASVVRERGGRMRLRIVGDGAHVSHARHLARRLNAPVEFLPRVQGDEAQRQYGWAHSVLVILRDWPSMAWTVPSKLYEAIATGRHVTASVEGESARIVQETGAGDVVTPNDPEGLAALWLALIEQPERLTVNSDTNWLSEHADRGKLADRYADVLRRVSARHIG